MPCNSCSGRQSNPAPGNMVYSGAVDCEYTVEQVISWKVKLHCIKDDPSKVNLTVKKFNSFLGTVYSITEYPNNPCYFKKSLDEIAPYITLIINLNLC